jgi:U5 small nuclear ribonucleoprotein component
MMDMLFQQTHAVNTLNPTSEKHLRYTDTRIDEQERQISIKTVPMSLVLEDSAGKSYLCNIMDTPGHVNFSDEMTAALRLADGAVLVVDAVEGVMVSSSYCMWFQCVSVRKMIFEMVSMCLLFGNVRVSLCYAA